MCLAQGHNTVTPLRLEPAKSVFVCKVWSVNTLVNVYVDLVVFTHIAVLHRPEVVDIDVNTI